LATQYAELTQQQVKGCPSISESTYKRKVKDSTLKPIELPGGDRFYVKDLLGCLPGEPANGPYLITPALPVLYPLLLPS
jgi:hypothetical protein